jgi:drug/metabolite transporter (DMT)-like permease
VNKYRTGFLYAFLGITIFSFTLPMVKLSLPSFAPWTLTFGRAAIAGTIALVLLIIKKVPIPDKKLWSKIFVTSLGIVVGFPVLTTFALQQTTSAHGAVIIAGLPMATAVIAVIRLSEREPIGFWIAALIGTATLVGYALSNGGNENSSLIADLMLFGAVLAAAIGYAEGALLTKVMPGWQVVSWCVLILLPITIPVFIVTLINGWSDHQITAVGVGAFLFTAIGSMYLGFFAWYRGLSELGVTKGSQVQMLQALLTLAWSALLLGESVTVKTLLAASVVIACVAITQKIRAKAATA